MFQDLGFQVLRGAVSKDIAKLLTSQFHMSKEIDYFLKNLGTRDFSGDKQVFRSYSKYGFLPFDSLLKDLTSTIEFITGLELYPTYSYARIYYPGAILEPHTDRSSCEYSATLCLDVQGAPWEIYFKDLQGETHSLELEPGDLCVYQGTKLTHWREEYVNGIEQTQVFLHYVDRNGPHVDHKFDSRPMLGLNKSWKEKRV